jgi:hypothetical protein
MRPSDLLVGLAGGRAWSEIIIASAYVDTKSLDTLRDFLRKAGSLRDRGNPLPVTFLTGKRDGLNRIRTLKKLLAIESRPPQGITVNVLCPSEPLFHAKAYIFRSPRRTLALVGSFNWTRAGLEGRGECWLEIRGLKALWPLLKIILSFKSKAKPWKEEIGSYRERPIPSRGGGPREPQISDTARSLEDLEDISPTDNKNIEKVIRKLRLRSIRPRISVDRRILNRTDTYTRLADEYVPNAWFDADWEFNKPKNKTHRELWRVGYTVRYPAGGIVIFPRQRLPYILDAQLASAAKRLGIWRESRPPSQKAMLQYIKLVRSKKQ